MLLSAANILLQSRKFSQPNADYWQSFVISCAYYASCNILLVSFSLAVYRKLCLAFLTDIARLAILRRPPQAILRLYQKIHCQMHFFNLMFQDTHHVKLEGDLLDKCQDLPSNTQ